MGIFEAVFDLVRSIGRALSHLNFVYDLIALLVIQVFLRLSQHRPFKAASTAFLLPGPCFPCTAQW